MNNIVQHEAMKIDTEKRQVQQIIEAGFININFCEWGGINADLACSYHLVISEIQ